MRETAGDERAERFLRPSPEERLSSRPSGNRTGSWLVRLLVAGILLAAGTYAGQWLLTSDLLAIRSVRFAGHRRVSDRDLEGLTREIVGQNLLRIDLSTVSSAIRGSSPWLRAALVRRVFPAGIHVDLVEHEPYARLVDDHLLVSSDGRLLPAGPELPTDTSLPAIEAAQTPSRATLQSAVELTALLQGGLDPLLVRIRSIDVNNPENFVLRFIDASYVVNVGNEDFRRRLNRFRNAEELLETRYTGLQTVDLRFDNQVVVAPALDPGGRLPSSGG